MKNAPKHLKTWPNWKQNTPLCWEWPGDQAVSSWAPAGHFMTQTRLCHQVPRCKNWHHGWVLLTEGINNMVSDFQELSQIGRSGQKTNSEPKTPDLVQGSDLRGKVTCKHMAGLPYTRCTLGKWQSQKTPCFGQENTKYVGTRRKHKNQCMGGLQKSKCNKICMVGIQRVSGTHPYAQNCQNQQFWHKRVCVKSVRSGKTEFIAG